MKLTKLTKSLEEILTLPPHALGLPLLRPRALTRKAQEKLTTLCPTRAFYEEEEEFRLDLARCVGCGLCFQLEAVEEMRSLEVAATRREDLIQRVDLARQAFVEPDPPPPTRKVLHLGVLAFREVSAGNTGLDDSEIALLGNPFHDMGRFGFRVVASPRHADTLLVTGPVSRNMREALLRTYEAMPEPKGVVAVGNEAISGELFAGSPEVLGGVDQLLPVDVYVLGSPPRPGAILFSLLLLSGRVRQRLVGGQVG